jgi:hypothetical protein
MKRWFYERFYERFLKNGNATQKMWVTPTGKIKYFKIRNP